MYVWGVGKGLGFYYFSSSLQSSKGEVAAGGECRCSRGVDAKRGSSVQTVKVTSLLTFHPSRPRLPPSLLSMDWSDTYYSTTINATPFFCEQTRSSSIFRASIAVCAMPICDRFAYHCRPFVPNRGHCARKYNIMYQIFSHNNCFWYCYERFLFLASSGSTGVRSCLCQLVSVLCNIAQLSPPNSPTRSTVT